MDQTAERGSRPAGALGALLIAVVALGCAVVIGERLWVAQRQPLWFDETWTGMIAAETSWGGFAREVWLDVNAPLYYLIMRGWTGLFGLSDAALKAPGLIAAAAAAALPLLVRVKGLSLEARLTWAGMICAWWGVDNFLHARCYGLLLALSVAQVLAFARLIERPDRGRALTWCVLASAAILTQYYALVLAGVQGLMFLAIHRQRALRAWPAALAFAPAFGWIALHWPRLAQYAAEDVAWHAKITAGQVVQFFAFTVGPASAGVLALLALGLAAAIWIPRLAAAGPRDEAAGDSQALVWTAVCGAIALGIVLASAMLKPTLTARYLIPVVPAMLLGVVLAARASRRARLAYLGLALFYFVLAARTPAAVAEAGRSQSPYGLAVASEMLRVQAVSDLVFIWDHPAARIMDPASLAKVGGFFLARAGAPAPVTPLYVSAAQDPNRQALAAARGPRPGVIWIFDRTGRTASARFPPAIARADPRWTCQTIGDGMIGALACWRR